MKLIPAILCILAIMLSSASAFAEVRFGKNVRVGGHDFSNQTFNEKRRGRIHIYEGKPKNEGCTWKRGKNGEHVKVCHLQRKPIKRSQTR